MRFTHAYAQPLCEPSRVKIMTGRYNRRNYTEWGVLPPGEITFVNLLRDARYATFAAGKWQLTHELLWPVEEPCCLGEGQTPEQSGFADYLLWYLHGKGRRYAILNCGTETAARSWLAATAPISLPTSSSRRSPSRRRSGRSSRSWPTSRWC